MTGESVRGFYDQLAESYHLLYRDWSAAIVRQGDVLYGLIQQEIGDGSATILDAACGIGTQSLGLAAHGHRVVAVDLSPVAATRAAGEAAVRGLALPTAAADMRALPFRADSFDAVVCADNALPHLLTPADLRAALGEMRRILRPGGLLMATTRDYDALLETHPQSTAPQATTTSHGRAISFQLWNWHNDGEHYDLELFQLTSHHDVWSTHIGRATYWALTRQQLTDFARTAGFERPVWHFPEQTGFFQPALTARNPMSP
ncbi:methyltransferase domain-containing protein [Nocardia sp. GCM10030253]|uniref:class I SAM-dependent methyltransferase n=1 Tax=Nocardia sp. GCM10030253 TaxID=3273404 RepID=UPI00364514D6